MRRILIIISSAIVLASCYESELHNTDHPTAGRVAVGITMPAVDAGVDIPENFVAVLGDEELTIGVDGQVEFAGELESGDHTIYIYSDSEGVDVDRTIESGEYIAKVTTTAGVVENDPKHLFFGEKRLSVVADNVISSSVKMSQITRELKFDLEITEGDPKRIKSIEASLSGVANQWSCVSDQPYGVPVSVEPELVRSESISRMLVDNKKFLTASVVMLGTNGAKQVLTIKLTFTDDMTQTIESDISKELAAFNGDKSISMTLKNDIETPVESAQGGTIGSWEVVTGGNVEVN